jgi:tetratricopeptide (TPR) repeat protein
MRAHGKVIPFDTLGKVAQGRVAGVLRFQQLLDVYAIPPALALDLVAVEPVPGDRPPGTSPEAWLGLARRQWNRGEIARALGTMYALRQAVEGRPGLLPLRQEAQLQFATAVADLGRLHLARHLLERLLREPLPRDLLLRSLLRLTACWERLGGRQVALALLARAEAHAPGGGPREEASLAHHRGLLDLAEGRLPAAGSHLAAAQRLYVKTGDAPGAAEATLGTIRVLTARGEAAAAGHAARRLATAASAPGLRRFRTGARVLQGYAELAGGDVERAVLTLREALSAAVVEDNPGTRFLAHHYLARAYAKAGDRERAGAEEHQARQLARYVDFTPDP